jgi:hypothetical protein
MALAFRGPIALVEIAAVGVIAVLSVAASWSLLNDAPHGLPLARIALIATTSREILALCWTRLPSNVAPGTRGFYAAMMTAHAVAWLAYLARARRRVPL